MLILQGVGSNRAICKKFLLTLNVNIIKAHSWKDDNLLTCSVYSLVTQGYSQYEFSYTAAVIWNGTNLLSKLQLSFKKIG